MRPLDYLFVAGCGRTGTTAMAELLNRDPRIILGIERFKYVLRTFGPDDFAPGRFFQPTPQETNVLRPHFYEHLKTKYEEGGLRYIGDKVPAYWRILDRLASTFEGSRIIFMFRDLEGVASSFNVRASDPGDGWPAQNDYRIAVEHWNESLRRIRSFSDERGGHRAFVVQYERFFAGEQAHLEALYRFLDLGIPRSVAALFGTLADAWPARKRKPLALDDDMLRHLNERKDCSVETWCLNRVAAQTDVSTQGAMPA